MPSSTYVALLRGINVGGKNKLPMKELAALMAATECAEVQTYIQSGNVVFQASASVARRLPEVLAERIAQRFGLRVPVVIRSAKELAAVARGNPFLKRGEDEDALHVYFLADKPSARAVAALDPRRSPGDQFEVVGREIYLFCPNGVGNTKLSNAYFDSALETVSTGRNWRTVLKLIALSSGSDVGALG